VFQRPLPDRIATFHRGDSGPLRVGAAEADVTPEGAPYLAGFALARTATGVHSRLKARVIVFEVGSLRIAVVGIDNLGLQRDDVDWIKAGIPGFANGNVLVCSSHTHAAPDLIGLWGWYFLSSGRDRDYLADVRRGVARAVADAVAELRPARLVRGEANVPAEGVFKNSNRRGVFDRRLTVLQAIDANTDEPFAALLHVACHPEALRRSNTKISADFVGDLCDRWTEAGLGRAVFVNGALGAMVTPVPAGEAGVSAVGSALMGVARAALGNADPVTVHDAEVRRRDVLLDMQSSALRLTRLTLVVPRETYAGALRSTVGYLRIGELEACLLPGEVEPALAASIVVRSHRPRLLVIGLVDDEVGYLMRERDARDPLFAYERTMSPGPRAGEVVAAALVGR
jgi:hypothetical protein